MRLGERGQRQRGEIAEAELENARRQREDSAVGAHVTEGLERLEEPASRGTGQIGAAGDVAEVSAGFSASKADGPLETASEGLDELSRITHAAEPIGRREDLVRERVGEKRKPPRRTALRRICSGSGA